LQKGESNSLNQGGVVICNLAMFAAIHRAALAELSYLSTVDFSVSNSIQIQNSRVAQSNDAMLIADYIAVTVLIVSAVLWAVL
jgi:hypothetical protein